MREAVILVADTHINSKTGLCPPDVVDDDGDIHIQNLIQEWLWHKWNNFLEDVTKLTKKYYTTVVFNGDIVDLDAKHRSGQMVSGHPATIMRMAEPALEPLMELADRTFFVRGTEAHVGQSGWIEEMLAQKYNAEPDSEFGRSSWWQLRAIFSDVKFDIAHHTTMGTLPYTYANAISKLVQVTRLNYLEWGEEPPDVLVRAHRHKHVDTGTTFPTRGICLPCWQFQNAFLYRINKENDMPHIGGAVFLCNKGDYQYIPLLYKPKRSSPWTRR